MSLFSFLMDWIDLISRLLNLKALLIRRLCKHDKGEKWRSTGSLFKGTQEHESKQAARGQSSANPYHHLYIIDTINSRVPPFRVYTFVFPARHWHHKAMGPVGARQPLCTHQARALCAIVLGDRLNEGECFSVPGCVGDTCWVGLHRPALLSH